MERDVKVALASPKGAKDSDGIERALRTMVYDSISTSLNRLRRPIIYQMHKPDYHNALQCATLWSPNSLIG